MNFFFIHHSLLQYRGRKAFNDQQRCDVSNCVQSQHSLSRNRSFELPDATKSHGKQASINPTTKTAMAIINRLYYYNVITAKYMRRYIF